MDEFAEVASRESEARRIVRRQWFWLHFSIFVVIQVFLITIWALGSVDYPWFIFPLFGWGTVVAAHAVFAFIVRTPEQIMIERAARESQG
jgi:uncharacterized membrane protein